MLADLTLTDLEVVTAQIESAATAISGASLVSGAKLEYLTVTVDSGAAMVVLSGLTASTITVSSGGALSASAGGSVVGLTLHDGGQLVDDGQVIIGSAQTFKGTVSGSGSVVVSGSGDLILSDSVGGSFPVTSDGHGGTLIDPRAATIVQAAASLAPRVASQPHASSTAVISVPLIATAGSAAHG